MKTIQALTPRPSREAMRPQYERIVGRAFHEQNKLNEGLHQGWTKQGWLYYRALITEAGEAISQVDEWVWWKDAGYKKPITDRAQKQYYLELVDILQFGLSMEIVGASKSMGVVSIDHPIFQKVAAAKFVRCFNSDEYDTSMGASVQYLETMMWQVLEYKEFRYAYFAKACMATGLHFEGLMSLYFAKVALNRFRYGNGYNLPKGDPGKYVKHWPGELVGVNGTVEDNEVLSDIVFAFLNSGQTVYTAGVEEFSDHISEELDAIYKTVKKGLPL